MGTGCRCSQAYLLGLERSFCFILLAFHLQGIPLGERWVLTSIKGSFTP